MDDSKLHATNFDSNRGAKDNVEVLNFDLGGDHAAHVRDQGTQVAELLAQHFHEALVAYMRNAKTTHYPHTVAATDAYPTADEDTISRRKDKEHIESVKSHLDALLTFAGIFSAAVAAFSAVYFAQLNPLALDPSSAILSQISTQVASFHEQGTDLNSTAPPFTPALGMESQGPARLTMAVNILWFTALICSLTAACINIATRLLFAYCILPENGGRDFELVCYKVAKFLTNPNGPLLVIHLDLLEFSVISFLIGLVCLLWNLNITAAYVVLGEVICAFGVISVVFAVPALMQTFAITFTVLDTVRGIVAAFS
ncbi:hypothetical protein WOLCODRAFT_147311 [Wolfiporia cocos MD-104 SS10]|uniref:DUF6535 domain-containing protein n=1 Tax=Wolfiporia cocos (strain MD-104) TaxID=742152 RepID=A0A2H3J090_WOLCO|nr:hypothetical protein WOLCODRAFT_147311 [Wolfiporia cocos MD-104 SS10]